MYGRIDYVVPNAAVNLRPKAGYFDAEESQLQKMFDVNYKAAFFLIKDSLPYLKQQKGSAILLVSTVGVYMTPRNQ